MLRPWKRRVSSSRIPTSRAPAAAVRRSTSKRGRFFVQLLRFQKSELKNASADAGAFCLQQQTLLRIVGRADRLHRLRNGGVGWCIAGWRGDNNTASADLLHPGIVDEEPLIVFFVVELKEYDQWLFVYDPRVEQVGGGGDRRRRATDRILCCC